MAYDALISYLSNIFTPSHYGTSILVTLIFVDWYFIFLRVIYLRTLYLTLIKKKPHGKSH